MIQPWSQCREGQCDYATQEEELLASTVPPTNEREAAIVATLTPGNYTAIVRGKADTTGVALVEAYNLP